VFIKFSFDMLSMCQVYRWYFVPHYCYGHCSDKYGRWVRDGSDYSAMSYFEVHYDVRKLTFL